MEEIWKDIPGYENLYKISSTGNVKNCKTDKLKKVCFTPNGYSKFGFYVNKIVKHISGHRLVAISFIPNPKNLPCVNHINGIKSDNRVENLEWCTYSDNSKHSYKIGLSRQDGDHHATKKLTWIKVKEIRLLHATGKTKYELSSLYGVHPGHINNIIANLYWKE